MTSFATSFRHEDWDDESDGSDDAALYEDRSSLCRTSQFMGYNKYYVWEWGPMEAFREFTQNWKDAIMETNQLTQAQCKVIVHGFDSKDIYTAEVRHPSTQFLLGYIRWQGGTVEISNFKSQMRRQMLDIGVTTKTNSREAAGKHGEGFKVGALVMTRNRYRVRYEASSFYWTFRLGGRDAEQLYCSLSPVSENKVEKLKDAYAKKLAAGAARKLQSNLWEDVTVKIGRVQGAGERVDKEDFLRWVDVSFDLNYPSKTIETRHGSLILDEKFAGRVYLKSLLLRGESFEKALKYGYNFLHGSVQRDRTRLDKTGREAKILAEIWEDAIRRHGSDLIDKYLALLYEDAAADVHKVESCISEFTAKAVWSRLLERDPERHCFYHDTLNGDKDAEIIKNSLRKDPVRLPTPFWDSLRKFKLVRTPREQQCHLLHNAPIADHQPNPYAIGLFRALRAALALDRRTQDLSVIFKDVTRTDFDVILFDSTLEINSKWLDFKQGHSETACWLSRRTEHDKQIILSPFSCDHIVSVLYELVLDEVMRHQGLAHGENHASKATLCQKVSENLRHMPMMIETCLGGPGEIVVSWIDMEGGMVSRIYGLDPKFSITLHRESSCAARRDDLLRTNLEHEYRASPSIGSSHLGESSCGCPHMLVPQKDLGIIFRGLDHQQEYFPMVARDDTQTFFGLAPKSLRPTAPPPPPIQLSVQTRAEPRRLERVNVRQKSPSKVEINNGNLYDADSSDEANMQVDSPILRPSSQSSVSGPETRAGNVRGDTPSRQFTPHRPQMRAEFQNLQLETKSQQEQLLVKDQEIANLTAELDSTTLQLERSEGCIQNLRDAMQIIERELEVANGRIENLTMRDQDTTGIIEGLKINIQEAQQRIKELLEEREELESRLVEAEEAYDMQVSLAARAVARRRPVTSLKRERDGSRDVEVDSLARDSKRPRNVITTRVGGTIDLTGEESAV